MVLRKRADRQRAARLHQTLCEYLGVLDVADRGLDALLARGAEQRREERLTSDAADAAVLGRAEEFAERAWDALMLSPSTGWLDWGGWDVEWTSASPSTTHEFLLGFAAVTVSEGESAVPVAVPLLDAQTVHVLVGAGQEREGRDLATALVVRALGTTVAGSLEVTVVAAGGLPGSLAALEPLVGTGAVLLVDPDDVAGEVDTLRGHVSRIRRSLQMTGHSSERDRWLDDDPDGLAGREPWRLLLLTDGLHGGSAGRVLRTVAEDGASAGVHVIAVETDAVHGRPGGEHSWLPNSQAVRGRSVGWRASTSGVHLALTPDLGREDAGAGLVVPVGYDVTVAVGPDWLRGKRFPVVLDPSLVFGNADGTVFDATTVVNGNYALVAHTDDRVGPQVEYNYMWRSYLRFNTSAIPAGATVTSARFHWVRQWGGSYSPRPLELHAINGDWNMNSSSYTMNSLTDATAAATGTPDTQDFDVTALARDWVSGARGNYGISAQLNPEVMNDAYAYGFYGYYASRSTSAPSPDVTPHLFVTYNQTTPLPVDVTSLTPHNAAMTATWSTSKDKGPNGPDGYYVGYANGQPVTGNSVTFGSAYNPYSNSWTNFPNGYALSVRVNPHNGAGFGGWGAARSATVQGAPSAVYGPDGNPAPPPSVVVGDGTVSASWTQGNLNGGPLVGYVAFLYPVGQHWPQAATATCYPVLSGTVTFGPAPSGDCSSTAPVNGTAYTVEVFEQNYSGDNYSGPLTDNTGTGPGYGPPATSAAATPVMSNTLTLPNPGCPDAGGASQPCPVGTVVFVANDPGHSVSLPGNNLPASNCTGRHTATTTIGQTTARAPSCDPTAAA